MAVIPLNIARVSQNLRAYNLLETVQRNQSGLFRAQNQLATGLRILQPSDDPLGAAAAGAMDRRLEEIEQTQRNLLHANNALTLGETAMKDAIDLLMQTENIASQTVGDSVSADERKSLTPVVKSVLDQLVAVGNRKYLNTYLFAGHYDGAAGPFAFDQNGVTYRGDTGRMATIVDTDMQQDAFTIPGAEFFAAVSSAVRGVADLDPALTRQTRISDLRGTTGHGVTLGRITVSAGGQQTEINLTGADTVGDVLDQLNHALPANLHADLNAHGIVITGGLGGPTEVTIQDVGAGQTARDLGLSGNQLGLPAGGADLDPRLTSRTRLADLNAGGGLDLSTGLTIRNGNQSATLNFAGAETLEDVLNKMNQANVGVWARLAADGRTIEVVNRVSGSNLTIEENGGQLATALGIRSLYAGTKLADLNDGRGVQTVPGADLRVVTADGTVVEVDLDGAQTLADVIARLNTQGGGAITVGLATTGNGLTITDNTAGAERFRVERANLSPALDGLGLDVTPTGNVLVGRDVNPVRVDSAFTALLELNEALQRDDRQTINLAGQRLERALQGMREVQGRMAAQAKAMDERATRMEDETTAAKVLLSDARDVDVADAVVRFQQMQTALQANLTVSSRIMNLSLLDYLR